MPDFLIFVKTPFGPELRLLIKWRTHRARRFYQTYLGSALHYSWGYFYVSWSRAEKLISEMELFGLTWEFRDELDGDFTSRESPGYPIYD